MGWADFLGPDNPFQQFVAGNRGKLGQIAAGLGSGQNLSAGLSNAAQNLPQGQQADDAYATAQKADAERAKSLNATLEFMRQKGYGDLVAGVEGGGLDMGTAWGEALKRGTPKTPESFTLGPGEARYQGDQLIAQGPEDTKAAFGNEKDLYAQYAAADPVKAYEVVKSGYERVRQSSALQSGAGDMGLIYGYMKMLDPGSVVRESEFAMAAQAGSYGEQIQGMVQRVIDGQRLPESVRSQFVQAADGIYKETAANLGDINSQFSNRATNYNVDPSMFIRQPETYQPVQAIGGDIQTLVDKYR